MPYLGELSSKLASARLWHDARGAEGLNPAGKRRSGPMRETEPLVDEAKAIDLDAVM